MKENRALNYMRVYFEERVKRLQQKAKYNDEVGASRKAPEGEGDEESEEERRRRTERPNS